MGFGVEDEVVDEDEELKRALALSREDIDVEDEEADLRRAIQLSMQGKGSIIQRFQKGLLVPSSFSLVLIRLYPWIISMSHLIFSTIFTNCIPNLQ